MPPQNNLLKKVDVLYQKYLDIFSTEFVQRDYCGKKFTVELYKNGIKGSYDVPKIEVIYL